MTDHELRAIGREASTLVQQLSSGGFGGWMQGWAMIAMAVILGVVTLIVIYLLLQSCKCNNSQGQGSIEMTTTVNNFENIMRRVSPNATAPTADGPPDYTKC